ncbi:MAG: D-amino acid dehydrogenase [Alphaproteobacteria bacterium]
MKTLILGGGLIGVSTAYFLARAGHDVTVIERKSAAGMDTSYANGGQLSAGQSIPWANPHTPFLLAKWLGRANAPLVFHPLKAEAALWRWGMSFLRNCLPGRTRANAEKILKLALYSRDMMDEIVGETGIQFDHNRAGILQIFRDRGSFERAKRDGEWLSALGCRLEPKSAEECVAIDGALDGDQSRFVGGLYSPDDSCGDAHLFAKGLAEICARMGVRFLYDTEIVRVSTMADKVSGIMTSRGMLTANHYVMALGSYSTKLLAPLGVKIPVYPAKGYSVTLPVGNQHRAPRISITDDAVKLVYSRLGQRLRIAGTAEFAGYDTTLTPGRAEGILATARELFPEAGDFERAEFWTGLRPLTPDGAPIIGKTALRNLTLNTGHGTLGWTLAAASGRVCADLVSGQTPAVDVSGFGLGRFA